MSLSLKPSPLTTGFGIVIRSEFPILVSLTLNSTGNAENLPYIPKIYDHLDICLRINARTRLGIGIAYSRIDVCPIGYSELPAQKLGIGVLGTACWV